MVRRTHIHPLVQIVASHEPEALQHEAVVQVHKREIPGRNRVRGIRHRTPQKPLRLRVFRPFDVRQGVGVFQLRRASCFALHHVERAAVALDEFPERHCARPPRRVGVCVVGMENEVRPKVERILLLEFLKDACVSLREVDGRAVDFRLRLDGAYRLGRLVKKIGVVRTLSEWLVPDFPLAHDILVATDACRDVFEPSRERLLVPGDVANLHAQAVVSSVYRVAVGEANPWLDAELGHFAHRSIKPIKVVFAFLLLRLRPAGEEPPVLRAEPGDVFLHRPPAGVVAVERLATYRPGVRLDVFCPACRKQADLPKPRIELVQPLPRHTLARGSIKCLQTARSGGQDARAPGRQNANDRKPIHNDCKPIHLDLPEYYYEPRRHCKDFLFVFGEFQAPTAAHVASERRESF